MHVLLGRSPAILHRILARILNEGVLSHAMAEITERLRRAQPPSLPVHEERLERFLPVLVFHLALVRPPSAALEDRRAAHPKLVRFDTLANERELSHVRPRATIRAACHANHDLLGAHVEFIQEGAHAFDIGWHHALGFGNGEAAERQRWARHAEAGQRVDVLDQRDAVLSKDRLDAGAVRRLDVLKDDALCGREDVADVICVGQQTQAGLEAELPIVLHAAIVDVQPEEQVPVALLVPSHPIRVLPINHFAPRLYRLAEVRLDERAEGVDAERVHQVLHARVRANLAVAVVALRRQDRLAHLHNVVLVDEAKMVGCPRESRLLVVRSPHASSDHDIEAQQVVVVVSDDDQADVADVDVHRVVARHRDRHFELARKVGRAV
mmetsp:Transcript_23803/g.49253  ORF Transcript_23803/g.49253 Transcript_23803/m.49253 type:complete len:381 (+) Transcript_23803:322-1464(+)